MARWWRRVRACNLHRWWWDVESRVEFVGAGRHRPSGGFVSSSSSSSSNQFHSFVLAPFDSCSRLPGLLQIGSSAATSSFLNNIDPGDLNLRRWGSRCHFRTVAALNARAKIGPSGAFVGHRYKGKQNRNGDVGDVPKKVVVDTRPPLSSKVIEIFDGMSAGDLAARLGQRLEVVQTALAGLGEPTSSSFLRVPGDASELVALVLPFSHSASLSYFHTLSVMTYTIKCSTDSMNRYIRAPELLNHVPVT